MRVSLQQQHGQNSRCLNLFAVSSLSEEESESTLDGVGGLSFSPVDVAGIEAAITVPPYWCWCCWFPLATGTPTRRCCCCFMKTQSWGEGISPFVNNK